MGQHDRGQPGPGPGAAVLHLTEGVRLLHPEEQVFQAMLDGWRNQQLARNLAFSTIAHRRRPVAVDAPADLEEFSTELRAIKGASHSTLLAYQNALRLFMAYLTDIERSPNTVKAYAHDLKDWFGFLDLRGLDWREVRLEDLGEFVAWLRLPPAGRCGGVTMLPSAAHHCSAGTVNRKLSAVGGLYTFHARHGVNLC